MSRSLHLSESFVISCGTVTLDIDQSKVLVIYLRKTGEYCLPKGRKNVGERLEATAVRETYEETGYIIELLPLQLTTLATLQGNDDVRSAIPGGTTEPIAVTQRTTQGVLKIIFWYAARGDSCAIRQMNTTEQDDEDFDAAWCPMDEVVRFFSHLMTTKRSLQGSSRQLVVEEVDLRYIVPYLYNLLILTEGAPPAPSVPGVSL